MQYSYMQTCVQEELMQYSYMQTCVQEELMQYSYMQTCVQELETDNINRNRVQLTAELWRSGRVESHSE